MPHAVSPVAPDAGRESRTLTRGHLTFHGADERPGPVLPVATVATELSVAGTIRVAIGVPGGPLILDAIVSAAYLSTERVDRLRELLAVPVSAGDAAPTTPVVRLSGS